ncbi:MAG: dihydrofolate reductase family protein [Raineya sp.]|jgi:dihydrofolate reductase|nr:dihydrofolate reductase family protein [Raineya sp.]
MRKIVYYVASSLDGFIAGFNDDISGFVGAGNGVDKYLADLANFDTVIMGRKTYEFGYQYGLQAGQPAYPHMNHYIFSESLNFENPDSKVQVKKMDISEIEALKNQNGTDIYLCGGGLFAGWLLDNQKIDILKLKLNPLILGRGIKLFGESSKKYSLNLLDTQSYENSLQIMTYQIQYER